MRSGYRRKLSLQRLSKFPRSRATGCPSAGASTLTHRSNQDNCISQSNLRAARFEVGRLHDHGYDCRTVRQAKWKGAHFSLQSHTERQRSNGLSEGLRSAFFWLYWQETNRYRHGSNGAPSTREVKTKSGPAEITKPRRAAKKEQIDELPAVKFIKPTGSRVTVIG